MSNIVQFAASNLREPRQQSLTPGAVRTRSWYSGITATELTAYCGPSPNVTKKWVADRRLFTSGKPNIRHPVVGGATPRVER